MPGFATKLARVLGAPLRVRDPLQPADAIVILGAPLRSDGSLGALLDERVRAGVDLWSRGLAPIVCVTGGPTRGPTARAGKRSEQARGQGGASTGTERTTVREYRSAATTPPSALFAVVCEADAMARRALDLGVPESALRLERQARSTADNARLVARLLAPEGCRRVWVVSQPFHLRRALWLFRKYQLEPLAWHADQSIELTSPRSLRWVTREYLSILHYAAIEASLLARPRAPRRD